MSIVKELAAHQVPRCTPSLVICNGELAPICDHAIMHMLRILEEKERTIPV
ncbi:MAG: hypothetical protein PHH85_00115 [Candidatus Methanoperedens sp.]|nr:hypothetical protein [Candidatus Methanoperedens sp.]